MGEYRDKKGKLRDVKIELRFIDSQKFMQAPLESLVENLVDVSKFSHIDSDYVAHTSSGKEHLSKEMIQSKFRNLLANHTDGQFRLLLRKGVYPYEYMDSWDRFYETSLPPELAFFSSFNNKGISDEDYLHVQTIWREFNIQNMGEYHDLYLLTDTLLLANVFNEYRSVCIDNYDLDPVHFYTAPGLSWQALLKSTKLLLRPLLDENMLTMFESGIRGGIVQVVHQYAKANNECMKLYNPSLPSTYMVYLDLNNLYRWAMCQPLPTGGLGWIINDIDSWDGDKIHGSR